MIRLPVPATMVLVLCVCMIAGAQTGAPKIHDLELVTQLPPHFPQRIMGLAYDGEQLWATIYLGKGRFAKLDPLTLSWTSTGDESEHNRAIALVAGAFESPGAVCFANGSLWIAGAYGESFGSINRESWQIERLYRGKQREDESNASQTYASMVHDGTNLWIAWHWFRYDQPISQTQLVLKVDPDSGKVIAQYPLPGGTRNDGTHGLTWDGTRLWHMKDQRLSAIDPTTGTVTAKYVIKDIKRPSGLAWTNDTLWIAEFNGRIWRLPFAQ